MSYYRIRIDELNNGKSRYVPQEGFLVTHRAWLSTKSEIRWGDMHSGFDTEEEALVLINTYREYRAEKESNRVKSSTYKNID